MYFSGKAKESAAIFILPPATPPPAGAVFPLRSAPVSGGRPARRTAADPRRKPGKGPTRGRPCPQNRRLAPRIQASRKRASHGRKQAIHSNFSEFKTKIFGRPCGFFYLCHRFRVPRDALRTTKSIEDEENRPPARLGGADPDGRSRRLSGQQPLLETERYGPRRHRHETRFRNRCGSTPRPPSSSSRNSTLRSASRASPRRRPTPPRPTTRASVRSSISPRTTRSRRRFTPMSATNRSTGWPWARRSTRRSAPR